MDLKRLISKVGYDFIRLLEARNLIITSGFIGVYIFLVLKFPINYIDGGINIFDIPLVNQMENVPAIISISFLSVYLSTMIFVDKALDPFVKIRMTSKRDWFIGKITTVILLNVLVFLGITLISLIIGIALGKLEFGWGRGLSGRLYAYPYIAFYSHFKLLLINMLTFVFLVSAIGIASGLVYVKIGKAYVGMGLACIYMLGSGAFTGVGSKIIDAINFSNYIVFSRRSYMATEMDSIYLTVKEAVIYPGIILGVICLIGFILVKRMDFKIESGDNE